MLKRINDFLAGIPMTIAAGAFLVLSLMLSLMDISIPMDPAWIAVIISGLPLLYLALWRVVHNKGIARISSALLISIAMIAAIAIGDLFAAGEVAFIMALGAILEEKTTQRARKGLKKLISLVPKAARRISSGKEEQVPLEDIKVGDILRILPGESIPVDGKIVSGMTSIDQSVMTGESLPVDRNIGDEVFSGTVNLYGSVDITATKVGKDSSLEQMIRLVEEADEKKAPIQRIADRWASWLVPAALIIAILAYAFTGSIVRAVTVLVVFCPCALVLATPTAIMAAAGNCTKYGVLVREGDALERLAAVKNAAFDKTGTLTYGKPAVAAVRSFAPDVTDAELLSLAASAELRSEHPLGKALVERGRAEGASLREPEEFSMLPGLGVSASSAGRKILAGNAELLARGGASPSPEIQAAAAEYAKEGAIVVWLALDGKCAGFAAFSDEMRPSAPEAVRRLKKLGVAPVLLSGDRGEAVAHVSRMAGIDETRCECRPEDKIRVIREFQAAGSPVCMVGDGVNDAPALRAAHVGIAMGAVGSDIAVESADAVLVGDDIGVLPHLFALSRRMMRTIKLNMAFSMALNFAAIALAAAGILPPVAGALVHNAGSVLVIINSSLLLKWRGAA